MKTIQNMTLIFQNSAYVVKAKAFNSKKNFNLHGRMSSAAHRSTFFIFFPKNVPNSNCQNHICDALQQNREQATQAYFEIWTIEVGIGVTMTHLSILR